MSMKKISISLTDELNAEIRSAVDTGAYKSSSEVIREALRERQNHRELEALDRPCIRAAVEDGLASGEAIPASKFMFDELRTKISGKANRQAG